jgi:hypothetical protein
MRLAADVSGRPPSLPLSIQIRFAGSCLANGPRLLSPPTPLASAVDVPSNLYSFAETGKPMQSSRPPPFSERGPSMRILRAASLPERSAHQSRTLFMTEMRFLLMAAKWGLYFPFCLVLRVSKR